MKIERNSEEITVTVPLVDMEYAFDESEKPVKRRMIGIKGEAKQFKIIKDNFNFGASVKKRPKKSTTLQI